jgi:hypothetical protein
MDIIEIFWDNFPMSFAILFGFFFAVYMILQRFRKKGEAIQNEVMVFFKGNTVQTFPATVEKGVVVFNIDESEYREPIISKPRLNVKSEGGKDVIYRTFLYAEGIGTTEIPPLTTKGREAIKKALVDNNILDEEKVEEYDDNELIEFIKFYNFDIEQIQDRPMLKAFGTQVNMWANVMENVAKNMKAMEKGGTSNLRYLLIGMLFFFFGLFAGVWMKTRGYM